MQKRTSDQINLAHAQADDPANYEAVDHFDSEELVEGLLQITRRRAELNLALTPPISAANQQNAWNLMGFMIHAIQDFYAHSSWIEEGNTNIIAVGGLTGFGALTVNTSAPTIPSCFQSVSVGAIANPALCAPAGYPLLAPVSQMTTGYYDPLSAPSGKCDHGTLAQAIATCAAGVLAPGVSLIQVQGISKDSPCASYPLGPNHFTAASLAQAETLSFVQSIVADLNTANNAQGFCALLDLPSNTPICGNGVTWYLQGVTASDGETVTGSFVYDPDTNTYSAINITSSGGFRSPALDAIVCGIYYGPTLLNYEDVSPNLAGWDPCTQLNPAPNGVVWDATQFMLVFSQSLTNSGGTVPLSFGPIGQFQSSLLVDFDCVFSPMTLTCATENFYPIITGSVTTTKPGTSFGRAGSRK
jgi:hypothetical protein